MKIKRFLVVICALLMVLTAGSSQALHSPKILMYHLVLDEPYSDYTSLFVRPSDLDEEVGLLSQRGYRFLFADEYDRTAVPSVILTFDDGYEDNYTEMFPIIKKYGAKATVFLIADSIGHKGYLSQEQIREMSNSGLVSFQSHTKTHRDLTTLSNADIRTEFRYSKYAIEKITGKPVTAVSYPEGQYTDTMLKIVKEYFALGFSTNAREVPRGWTNYAIPRKSVVRDLPIEQFSGLLR